ncbi:MAG TPA: sugar ABC transporter substrate-binding protein [Fastidiosipila sp.]|nr:sugar ABC transporter substrate-binding protein [Fastidiosipila sp.]
MVLSLIGFVVACDNKTDPTGTTAPQGVGTDPAGSETEAPADPTDDKTPDGQIQVGIVLPTKDEPRWLQDQAQFEKILSSAGFTNETLFSQGKPDVEKTNVESLVNKGIKVLIICAHDAKAAAATVAAAKAEGVTIIAYDRLITDTEAVDYYVTFDSVQVGKMQGQYLVDNAAGEGQPLYLYAGAATDNNAFLFFEGAWSVLQPAIAEGKFVIANSAEAEALKDKAELTREEISKIIGQVTTDWDFNVAKSKAEANLSAADEEMKGDVAILAPNDGTARSIADTFAGDADITSYMITGQDSEKASVQYIIDGKQSMTVFKDTRTLAADSVAMAVDILGDKTPATDAEYDNGVKQVPSKQSPIVAVTKDNVKEALIDSEYYVAGDFTGLD